MEQEKAPTAISTQTNLPPGMGCKNEAGKALVEALTETPRQGIPDSGNQL
jgi:hypothetical protein